MQAHDKAPPLTLVILAAGRGSRYGGLKQWTPVGARGEPLIAYALWDAWHAGFERAVLVVAEGVRAVPLPFETPKALVIRSVEQRLDDLPGLSSLAERNRPWGTAHAVWAARHEISGPFAVLNADDYYGPQALLSLAEFLKKPQAEAFLVAYFLKNTLSPSGPVSRGICQTHGNKLVGIQEHTQIAANLEGIQGLNAQKKRVTLPPEAPVSMNCWALRESFWPVLEATLTEFALTHATSPSAECYLPDAIAALLRRGPVALHLSCDPWAGLTHPGDLAHVQALLKSRKDDGGASGGWGQQPPDPFVFRAF